MVHPLARGGALLASAACLALIWCGVVAAATAPAPWSPVVLPWDTSWTAHDVCAFGTTGVAVAGDGGHIAITRDGGASWKVVVPPGLDATAFTAIALGTDGHGAVASGGLLLVTDDGGTTWRTPTYRGPRPTAAISDIALRGSRVVAVGGDGVIMTSDDSGSTWSRSESPTKNALTSVAIAGDGTAVAGSATGEILVGAGDVWTIAGAAPGPVTSVAASADPLWGDGLLDLVAASDADVLGSDDALAFATLPGLPAPSSQPWSTVAWTSVPGRSLLIAGAQRAGFLETLSAQWVSGPSGLGAADSADTPAGQSVAYLLGVDGRLVRTLSAGRDPATAALGQTRIVVGATTRLTATVRIGAPGQLLLRGRVLGRAWVTQRTLDWTAADWNGTRSFSLAPSFTHEYSLVFKYGATTTPVTPVARLVVVPRIGTARSRYDLRRGDVFRFSGSVTPKLLGERVELFTDRGGSWRPVSLQRPVPLREGRTWTSRQFGTPKREAYHLRAHLVATSAHAEAWSRIVSVSIH